MGSEMCIRDRLIDYQDYLRVRDLAIWDVNDVKTIQTRRVCARHNDSAYYRNAIKERSDETIANIAITLIHQADIFLRKYINRVKDDFVKQGGIREQMSKARIDYRKSHELR